jgi:phage baseplate assembly protein W
MSHTLSWTLPPPGATSPSLASADEKRRLLGKDIFFNGDYDVGPSGDWVLIEGLEALRQAVYRRLMTRPGEYKLRPEYGVGIQDFVKRRRLPSTFDEIRQRVVDQLSLDPRIDEVRDVVVEAIADGIKLGIVIVAAGEALQFRPFNFTESSIVTGLDGARATTGLRIG